MWNPINTAPIHEVVLVLLANGLITLAVQKKPGRWATAQVDTNCVEYRANLNCLTTLQPIAWINPMAAILAIGEN